MYTYTLPLFISLSIYVLFLVSASAFREYDGFSGIDEDVVKKDPISKDKVNTLGAILKTHVQELRQAKNHQVDIVFLVDSSASVGMKNFHDELKFVRKLLADFTVDSNHTRVAVVTFSSRTRVFRQVDYIADSSPTKHKCSLLDEDLPNIRYEGGGTYTLGAILEAKDILKHSRPNVQKAVFLITDGYSNGGDPRDEARLLRESGVKMFTFGIRHGNVYELHHMASEPKNETCYILDSFEEFEALARRALHEDLQSGSYIPQDDDKCHAMCNGASPCCDVHAICRCGTHTGNYECVCRPGFYGTGVNFDCHPCPPGTFKTVMNPGDVSTCKKCPDENHITIPGATHESQCMCEKGFRDFNTSRCAAMTCPVLVPPRNGYFVNNICNNVFNAACGIKCKPGYELRGNSLRICQDTGEWSGETTQCIMKTCPALPKPKNGNMICDHDDFSFSTVCRFTCDTGYKLVGSRKRECLAVAFWTGITSRCREITCKPLPSVRDGNVIPAVCISGDVSFGTICKMECHQGYSLIGPSRKQCTPEGMWVPSTEGKISRCEDTSPPTVICPMDISVIAEEEESTAVVRWDKPVSFDNSGLLPIITVVPAIESPKRFPIGITYVRFVAEDLDGNKAKCRFSVEVRDITPPRVDRCYSPAPFVASTLYANVSWEEPVFSDNSEETPKIERSHAPGLFPRGTTIVTYTAYDESGNNNTCDIEITVMAHPCQYPPEPLNGRRQCRESSSGVHCTVSCMDGFAFAISPADEYFCPHDNTWSPEDKLPIPDCSVQTASNGIIQPASITFLSSIPCRQRTLLNHIEQTMEIRVSQRVTELCADNVICEVEDMQTTCEEEDDFNIITIILGRKKRDTNDITEVRRKPRQQNNGKIAGDSSLTFDFKIKGQVSTTGNALTDFKRQDDLAENFENILSTLNTEAKNGVLDINMEGKTVQFANMSYNTKTPKYNCKPGSILMNTSCVQCPRGTFFNVITEECAGCNMGSYQPLIGQVSCLVCPTNTSTNHNSSKSQQECKAQCLPGMVSPTGLERCATCEKGFYQSQYSQTECIKCPPGSTTWKRGARGIELCKEYCTPGHASKTGLSPCFPCPRGTYQPDSGRTFCYECLRGATTNSIAATDVSECMGELLPDSAGIQSDESPVNQQPEVAVNDCFSNECQNGGTCEAKDFGYTCKCIPGYKGNNCEDEIDECEGKPCLNNGTCRDLLNAYDCQCAPGYQGNKCEINIDDCLPLPCANNGTCIDLDNAYTCRCLEGFEGETCTVIKDMCESSPCLHGGSCQTQVGSYTCSCPTGYEGTNCEINYDECNSGPCQNGATCDDAIGTYKCRCVAGYIGKQCETEINECASLPCPNDATCVDKVNGFVCRCKKGFTGQLCDTELDNGYMLDFPAAGIFNYSASTIDQDLTSLTVSFWMKTDDVQNQGTPFSYASSDAIDNAFTMTSYDGFVVYINNIKLSTDVDANDGKWHHIVFTWSSNRGSWKIYRDGLSWDAGFNFGTGEVIRGGGTFVVGQEQDAGGVYSSSESFVGQITRLNIWAEELTLPEIEAVRTTCVKRVGTVIAWPDIQMGLHGSLVAEPSNFCRGCSIPSAPSDGSVSFTDTTAGSEVSYSCDIGFNMLGRNRRQCLITGQWEGQPPTCERVDCGYPGAIAGGYIEGDRFTFDNRIRYICYKGYHLVGNRTRYCNSTGRWLGTPPTCERIQCLLPFLSNNTLVVNKRDAYYPGDTAEFSCTVGNRLLTTHNTVVCQEDSTWDKSVPTCDPQTCTNPPSIHHGDFTETQPEYSVGFSLQYECDFGYEFKETSANPLGRISCLPSGQWETDVPQCLIITCPPPPTSANAIAAYASLDFNQQATYVCNEGYEREILYGDDYDSIVCTEDGVWDREPPECQPVDCGTPEAIPRGIAKADRTTFGSIATYQCNLGYTLQGLSDRTCQANSVWSGQLPLCSPIQCPAPSVIANGFHVGSQYTFGETISYACDGGYILVGTSDIQCGQNGQWSGQVPSCTRRTCNVPPSVVEGVYREDAYFYDDELTYSCTFGFEISGNDTIRCLEDGEWSMPVPKCTPVSCGEVGPPLNGNFTTTSITFGGRVRYFCDEGYSLKGETIRICQPDGYWSGVEPKCIAGKCSAPPLIANGNVDYKDLSYKSAVIYSCEPGYTLVGKYVRRCQKNLTFSDEEPVCVPKSCRDPGDIQHGTKSVTGLLYNSVVNYQCDTGYILQGEAQLTCSYTGEWSSSPPSCQIVQCESPARVTSNGRMIGDNFTFGAIISYECDIGYTLRGSPNRTCLANGKWDEKIPICEVVQCGRPRLRNGYSSGFQTEYDSRITFTCRSGYVLFGPSERRCLENGTWSGPDPVCVTCNEPPVVDYGIVKISNSKLANYTCLPNFELVGNSVLECTRSGLWSPFPPRCVPEGCDTSELRVDTFSLGTVNVTGSQLNDVAEYSCNVGFNLLGTSTRTCSIDGHWSGSVPICLIVTCPGSFNLRNGRIIGSAYTYNSNLTFQCIDNYRLIGNEYITCQVDGLWSGTAPVCEEILCPTLDDILYGRIIVQSYSVGSEVIYSCNQGYEIRELNIDQTKRTCTANGIWTGSDYTCEVRKCPDLVIENGKLIGQNYTIGSQILYQCDEGYRLSGIPMRICLYSKMWSGPDPECLPVECYRPPPINNGVILDNGRSSFFYGDLIQYTCQDGYFLHGMSDRTCQSNSVWSGEEPICSRVSCSGLPVFENSETKLLNGSISFGDMAVIECKEGFKLRHGTQNISTCNADGFWSRIDAECIKVKCPPVPVFSHGRFSSDNNEFGSEIILTCNQGYRVNGESTIRCQADSRWSAVQFPTCNIVLCQVPDDLANGLAEYADLTYGSEVVYRCNRGYDMVGSMNRTCNASGAWSGFKPYCREILCHTAPPILNGGIAVQHDYHAPGDIVRYQCKKGYVIHGNASITCSSSGEWVGALPQCRKVVCSRPVSPRNGQVSYGNVTFGSSITFTCNPGFEIRGSAESDCLETGLWSTDAPACAPVNCGSPASVTNAFVIGDSYIFQSVVTYLCEEGYELIGDENIVCLETAVWSGATPVCNPISCGSPQVIEHGRIIGNDFTYKKMVFYICDKGFELSGNNLLECGVDGDWIGGIPSCEPVTCGPPPILKFSTTTVTKMTFGGTATYMCNDGYILQGDMMTKCSDNGAWIVDPNTACVAVDCGTPPLILQGTRKYKSTSYLAIARYKCNPEYTLSGNDVIRCAASGIWKGALPTCSKAKCNPPINARDVTVIGSNFGLGQSVEFKCPNGHIIIGEARSQCTSEGVWSSAPPQCLYVNCGSLNIAQKELKITSDIKSTYAFDSVVNFTCSEGYVLSGAQSIRCTASGGWSGAIPSCVPNPMLLTSCPVDTRIRHAKQLDASFTVGDRVTVTCKDGYESVNDMGITCLDTGKWTSASGFCRRISCGKPVITDFVNVIAVSGRSYKFGDKVRFRCRPGIPPAKIPPVLACKASKSWDGEIACSTPCKGGCTNGGMCVGLRGCKCPSGYGGRRCEKAICILPCLNRGRCISPYKCGCPAGYTGSRCEKTVCNPPCENGGYCVKPNKCHCQHGYKLPFCSVPDEHRASIETLSRTPHHRHTDTHRETTTQSPGGWFIRRR